MTSLTGSIPVQAAVAEYLQQGGYDRHLRHLREVQNAQKQALVGSLARHLPSDTRIARPDGGYFLWVELPRDTVDAVTLYGAARSNQINIAAGPMFSNRNCLRLNFGHPWTPQMEKAIATLGRLVCQQPRPRQTESPDVNSPDRDLIWSCFSSSDPGGPSQR